MKIQKQTKNRILAVLTTLPILIGIILNTPLVISVAILTFFVPPSTYYLGLVLMALPKSKKRKMNGKNYIYRLLKCYMFNTVVTIR